MHTEQQLHMNGEDNYSYENQIDIIEDNVNVTKTSDIKEFFILIGGIVLLIFTILFLSDLAMRFFLDKMTYETQTKIESFLTLDALPERTYSENEQIWLNRLNNINNKIIAQDDELKKLKPLNIDISSKKEINAYILPNGNIYFTTGILNNLKTDEQAAFVLAHEIAHYKNRDHLKSIGRSILALTTISIIGCGSGDLAQKIMYSIYDIGDLRYSKRQEIKADRYASEVIKKIYGTNKGAIEFFQLIDKNQKLPEFVHYFSTHPSPQTRIRLLGN